MIWFRVRICIYVIFPLLSVGQTVDNECTQRCSATQKCWTVRKDYLRQQKSFQLNQTPHQPQTFPESLSNHYSSHRPPVTIWSHAGVTNILWSFAPVLILKIVFLCMRVLLLLVLCELFVNRYVGCLLFHQHTYKSHGRVCNYKSQRPVRKM